ncbi:MAG TPA: 3,4-dihydroxy-2-butanone-4-phosphate synthase [Planctomycetaceae bacterium]
MKRQFARIEDALGAIAAGRMVIVLDSEDRENEGDFVAAAEAVTPQMVHLMITHGRGQLCMPVLPDLARRLDLTPMVPGPTELSVPRFTVPVDHRKCHTGISPLERAFTIRSMLEPTSRPDDYLRPGHVFPLVARPEGVLSRTGHTESAVDLARLAGAAPAGVLCEICSRDGMHMATRDELAALARELRIPMITIDALVEYRKSESCHATADEVESCAACVG